MQQSFKISIWPWKWAIEIGPKKSDKQIYEGRSRSTIQIQEIFSLDIASQVAQEEIHVNLETYDPWRDKTSTLGPPEAQRFREYYLYKEDKTNIMFRYIHLQFHLAQ